MRVPLTTETLQCWMEAEAIVEGRPRRVGDRVEGGAERWVVMAVTSRRDLDVRLRQGKRRYSWTTLILDGKAHDAALVEELSRERAVKLGYKLGLPVVLRVGPGGLELCYTGR